MKVLTSDQASLALRVSDLAVRNVESCRIIGSIQTDLAIVKLASRTGYTTRRGQSKRAASFFGVCKTCTCCKEQNENILDKVMAEHSGHHVGGG